MVNRKVSERMNRLTPWNTWQRACIVVAVTDVWERLIHKLHSTSLRPFRLWHILKPFSTSLYPAMQLQLRSTKEIQQLFSIYAMHSSFQPIQQKSHVEFFKDQRSFERSAYEKRVEETAQIFFGQVKRVHLLSFEREIQKL